MHNPENWQHWANYTMNTLQLYVVDTTIRKQSNKHNVNMT